MSIVQRGVVGKSGCPVLVRCCLKSLRRMERLAES